MGHGMPCPIPAQKSSPPNKPDKRRPQRQAASNVDAISTMDDHLRQTLGPRRRPASSRYQPWPSRSRVKARKDQVSTRNAGAKASPVSPKLRKPNRSGTIHHQGRGRMPANKV